MYKLITMTNEKVNISPGVEVAKEDDYLTVRLLKLHSLSKTVLIRTTPTRTIVFHLLMS